MSAAAGTDVSSCGEEPGMTRIGRVAAVLAAVVVAQGTEFEREVAARAKPRTIGLSITMGDGIDDRIRSNEGQTYTHGVDGVVLYASENGLQFQLGGTRGLRHEFTACLEEPCASPYLSGTTVNVIQIHPLTPDGSASAGGLLGLPLNQERPALVKALLTVPPADVYWTLCADPRPEATGVCGASVSHVGVRIARTAATSWTVSASASSAGGRSDVFDLIKQAGSGKRSTTTVEGIFSMPFSMTIQCVVAADCPAP
jgi:hypothetical protein